MGGHILKQQKIFLETKRFRRSALGCMDHGADKDAGGFRSPGRKTGFKMGTRTIVIFVGCLLVFSLLVTLREVYQDLPLGWHGVVREQRLHRVRRFAGNRQPKFADGIRGDGGGESLEGEIHKENKNSETADEQDKLLGGLLSSDFDERTCLSRYHWSHYRRTSQLRLAPYLIDRLRKYESLHKRCGPYTRSYNTTVKQLKSAPISGEPECRYVVWVANSGLGNKILSIVSAFTYALLTDRVLLLDDGADLSSLFCEPFPESSWTVPSDFPLNHFRDFGTNSSERYGHMLKTINQKGNDVSTWSSSSPFLYVHLSHDYDHHDKLFFCDDEQLLLQNTSWIFLRTDNYFIPSLFLMPKFEEELSRLFPEKHTVFHHLGRYLFHPTNTVWGMITRFYDAYMAPAEEKIGIQIRTFENNQGPFEHVFKQILSCTRSMEILPEVSPDESFARKQRGRRKAVLITSLSGGYLEWMRSMYWEHPTANGDIISVHQPSHEEHQQTEKVMHNMKALAEIYLLSLNDVLITSAWSTFGYVAQGLGGVKPWILFKPENHTAPNPPCRRAISIEPCFHAPPFYDCKAKVGTDTGKIVPHVQHCEDMSWGLKVVGKDVL